MKKIISGIVILITTLSPLNAVFQEGVRIVEKGPHHRVIKWTEYVTNKATRVVSKYERGYVELAQGMHYLNEKGEYVETKEEIRPVPGGAVCLTGPHKVSWSGNINTYGAIEIVAPDGMRLFCQFICKISL